MLLWSLQLWQQLQRCRQTRARFFLRIFYFRSMEMVRRERYVAQGSERLQASARVKKRTAAVVST